MQCRMVELRCKEVINICDGSRLGYVGDDIILIDKPPERRPPFQDRRRKRRGLF